MGNQPKPKTKYVVLTAQQTLELCITVNYLRKGDHEGRKVANCETPPEEYALCDQPTQARSTSIVQLVSTRDLLETLDAAEELKLATLAVLISVFPCLRKPPPPQFRRSYHEESRSNRLAFGQSGFWMVSGGSWMTVAMTVFTVSTVTHPKFCGGRRISETWMVLAAITVTRNKRCFL